MRNMHSIIWLLVGIVLICCICLLLGMHYVNRLLPFAGIIGALLGTILGFGMSRYSLTADKRKSYIINAQNVLLILAKQLNEFTNIQRHFKP